MSLGYSVDLLTDIYHRYRSIHIEKACVHSPHNASTQKPHHHHNLSLTVSKLLLYKHVKFSCSNHCRVIFTSCSWQALYVINSYGFLWSIFTAPSKLVRSTTNWLYFALQIVNNDPIGRGMLAAHFRVDGHPNINPIHEVVVGDRQTYLFFPPCFTDLHSYVRTRRRLREPQARPLFRQIVLAVQEAHSKGIVLRDLKLRKFVFADESR